LSWFGKAFRRARNILEGAGVTTPFLAREMALVEASGMFDRYWYSSQYHDMGRARVDPLVHYLTKGWHEGRDPNPLFSSSYYLDQNRDVAATGINPLIHFLVAGAREGRWPNPLFDTSYYLARNPNVTERGLNPLAHYLQDGARGGSDPHPLFDGNYYLKQYPDVAKAGLNPLVHYLSWGGREGRNPHPLFDGSYYLAHNPDVAMALANPLVHYLTFGGHEGRDPNPSFDSSQYLIENPAVGSAGVNPLTHYVARGGREDRRTSSALPMAGSDYVPPRNLLPWFNPLNLSVSRALSATPHLNVLVPGLAMRHMSGGPNTAIVLACLLARSGVKIRFMSTDAPIDSDPSLFWEHVKRLLGSDDLPSDLSLVDAHDRSATVFIGDHDLFLATAWWTAQQAKYAVKLTKIPRFVYLIQDFEPLFHAASTPYALATETYRLDHLPLINTSLLYEFLIDNRIGLFSDEGFARRALVFEPALDRTIFHPTERHVARDRRRLLFYTRPVNGLRNLFELGVAALQKVIADKVFDPHTWEFLGIGENFVPVSLGEGAELVPAPWVDIHAYARLLRDSDIVMSLMLSPHPSYPPLEMAASGGLAVTTSFANKTRKRLARISPNIIAVDATIEGVAGGLEEAVQRLSNWDDRFSGAQIDLPEDWPSSLEPVVPRLIEELADLHESPTQLADQLPCSEPTLAYPAWLEAQAIARQARWTNQARVKFSILTLLYAQTPADLLLETSRSVLGQVRAGFEWIVIINGEISGGTRAAVQSVAADSRVRVVSSPQHVGIVKGLALGLHEARGDYIVPMDADDVLEKDALWALGIGIERTGADFIYSDADVLVDGQFSSPFFRPDFDPILNAECSYVWHLCAFRRTTALELNTYSDPGGEYCHDWDTLTKFSQAGKLIQHVPEILYHWRRHSASFSHSGQQNVGSVESTKYLLARRIAGLPRPDLYKVAPFPVFRGAEEHYIERKATAPPTADVVVLTQEIRRRSRASVALERTGFPFRAVKHHRMSRDEGHWAELALMVDSGPEWVALIEQDCEPLESHWPWEASKLFELHSDVAITCGRLIDRDGQVVESGLVFDERGRLVAPFTGQRRTDPGPYALALKPHQLLCPIKAFFVVRVSLISRALAAMPRDAKINHPCDWMAAFAVANNLRVASSPLLDAMACGAKHRHIFTESSQGNGFLKSLERLGLTNDGLEHDIRGGAGFVNAHRKIKGS
jgi:hypothetical protein